MNKFLILFFLISAHTFADIDTDKLIRSATLRNISLKTLANIDNLVRRPHTFHNTSNKESSRVPRHLGRLFFKRNRSFIDVLLFSPDSLDDRFSNIKERALKSIINEKRQKLAQNIKDARVHLSSTMSVLKKLAKELDDHKNLSDEFKFLSDSEITEKKENFERLKTLKIELTERVEVLRAELLELDPDSDMVKDIQKTIDDNIDNVVREIKLSIAKANERARNEVFNMNLDGKDLRGEDLSDFENPSVVGAIINKDTKLPSAWTFAMATDDVRQAIYERTSKEIARDTIAFLSQSFIPSYYIGGQSIAVYQYKRSFPTKILLSQSDDSLRTTTSNEK